MGFIALAALVLFVTAPNLLVDIVVDIFSKK